MAEKKWAHVPGPGRLQKWRADAELTQQQAASMFDIDLAKYNAYENGRERPGLDAALRIERITKGKVEVGHWSDESRARAS